MRWLVVFFALFPVAARAQRWIGPAERLIEEWRITEAVRAAAPLLRDHAGDGEVIYLDGDLLFLQGDYAGAARRLREAIAHAPPGAPEGEWRGLADLAAATAEATRGFAEARSPGGHFIIRYAPGKDALLLPYAFEALEAAYKEVGVRDFGDAPVEPVRVEIYPEVADLAKVSTLTQKEIETSGTIALCKFNRLMIVSPRALVRGYPWLDTLAHEYTHFVVSRASYNSVPIWLHEGLAKFEERRWRDPDDEGLTPTMEHLLATALAHNKRLITFAEMYPSMAKLPSQADTALAFAEVFTVVEYLHERKGWEGVRAVIERMKAGESDAGAIASVLGETFDEFQRDWKAWLKAKRLKMRPGLVPASLKFVTIGSEKKSSKKEEDDSQDITEERARKFARLGGMLRAHGRLGPAAVEYEKAQALVGAGHPAIADKLARTYLALNDPDQAIATAEPALALYPDLAGPSVILGEAYLKKGLRDQAAPLFDAAIRISPFDPTPHCGLAKIYAAKSDARAPREQNACAELSGE